MKKKIATMVLALFLVFGAAQTQVGAYWGPWYVDYPYYPYYLDYPYNYSLYYDWYFPLYYDVPTYKYLDTLYSDYALNKALIGFLDEYGVIKDAQQKDTRTYNIVITPTQIDITPNTSSVR